VTENKLAGAIEDIAPVFCQWRSWLW